jgi:hypothetical protein
VFLAERATRPHERAHAQIRRLAHRKLGRWTPARLNRLPRASVGIERLRFIGLEELTVQSIWRAADQMRSRRR